MAVVGLVFMAAEESADAVHAALQREEHIVDVERTADQQRLAVVLEIPAHRVQDSIRLYQSWDAVLSVDVAYVNYEEELAEGGEIPCAPYERKRRGEGAE